MDVQKLNKCKDAEPEDRVIIRMPSEGQIFKLLGTRFEIKKVSGTTFKATVKHKGE